MTTPTEEGMRRSRQAMSLSLGVSFLQLGIKVVALLLTGSAAVFADTAESTVHLLAVGFAFFSLRLAHRPPDRDHRYGHGKIGFFSAGVEGGIIFLAALFILGDAFRRILSGPEVQQIGWGIGLVAVTVLLNTALGWYLVRTGRREHELILVANGWHVLTDAWTSVGVLVGLALVAWSGWVYWDPVCAILVAFHILITGGRLIGKSFGGLMDLASEGDVRRAEEILAGELRQTNVTYHALRLRPLGNRLAIDLHLVFDDQLPLREAHEFATNLERTLAAAFSPPASVMTHLEPRADHARVHWAKEEN
jgi:cation diffusion facilitator family transporter